MSLPEEGVPLLRLERIQEENEKIEQSGYWRLPIIQDLKENDLPLLIIILKAIKEKE